jgi:hypothetical protein
MSDNIVLANLIISSLSIFLIPLIGGIVNCMTRVKHSRCCKSSEIDFDENNKKNNNSI